MQKATSSYMILLCCLAMGLFSLEPVEACEKLGRFIVDVRFSVEKLVGVSVQDWPVDIFLKDSRGKLLYTTIGGNFDNEMKSIKEKIDKILIECGRCEIQSNRKNTVTLLGCVQGFSQGYRWRVSREDGAEGDINFSFPRAGVLHWVHGTKVELTAAEMRGIYWWQPETQEFVK